jgi:hypothetical protein
VDRLDSILRTFEPISLENMDKVELMNRKETKYTFSSKQLADVITKASEYYYILEIENIRNFLYRTTYLDTTDYLFFNHHAIGKLNRYKVRYRVYESTGGSYLEIKCKSNKMRTIKWRIKNQMQKNYFDEKATNFLAKYIGAETDVQPILENWFNRITLVSKNLNERVTFDFNLSFSPMDGKKIELPYLAIAEIKFEKTEGLSPINKIFKDLCIRPSSFSKYCIGNILLNNPKRINSFKPKLLTLEKLKYDYFICASA